MAGPLVKGWCPGALRPMLSGDGWLVRIRPPLGVLTPVQAAGVARASLRYGNGVIDLSSRANLQLRGIRDGAHDALIDDLRELALVDADETAEAARNLIITPFRVGAPHFPPTPHFPPPPAQPPPPPPPTTPRNTLFPSPTLFRSASVPVESP